MVMIGVGLDLGRRSRLKLVMDCAATRSIQRLFSSENHGTGVETGVGHPEGTVVNEKRRMVSSYKLM